jgi:RNA polymerase sigma-70 factor (ECF subfamily)
MCLADDIVQETFVKLAIKKPPFRGKCSFKTWLFTIARNCAVDHLRKDQKISDLSLDEHLVISDVTDTEKEYFKEEQKKELYRAMKRLNPEYYQVLYLMYFEDLDTSDIARIMHKAKRQVSDLIFRARKSLRSELERKGFIYERY